MDAAITSHGTVFISRAGEDRVVTEQIKSILRKAGYETYVQEDDFGHTSFMERMAQGFRYVDSGGCLLVLLSSCYQQKPHCLKEARYPLIDDPMNRKERLVVLRIDRCEPRDFLKDIPYVDLVPYLDDELKLDDLVLGSVERSLSRNSGAEDEKLLLAVANASRVEKLILFLENEDQEDLGKGVLSILVVSAVVGFALMGFEYLLHLWNGAFGTSYEAIIDTSWVLLSWIGIFLLILFVVDWKLRELAKVIENAQLTPSHLRILRKRVAEQTWRSKWLIDAVISKATRNITMRR